MPPHMHCDHERPAVSSSSSSSFVLVLESWRKIGEEDDVDGSWRASTFLQRASGP
jgi:hypothetical protein